MSTAILRRRLIEIDAEIVEQKMAFAQKLAALDRDRADVQHKLDASTFAVVTLPVEIAAEIFTLCLPSIEELRANRYPSSHKWKTQAPMVFLATTLYLRLDIIHDDVAEKEGEVEAFIERWLQRAAARPLSLGFQTRRSEGDDLADHPFIPSRLRDVIRRYAPRIQYLELELGQNDMSQLRLDSTDFPLLQRATLGGLFDPEALGPVEVFTNAPKLHDLHLIHHVLFYYSPPFQQLTKFDGEIVGMNLFTLAPNLIEARCSVDYISPAQTSFISHSRLQSLTLFTTFDGTGPCDILQHLTLPALQSLHMSEMEDATSLAAFLSRSSPSLRTLSIRIDDDEFFDWGDCLSLVAETLENLEVVYPFPYVQSAILTCHTRDIWIKTPLPRLQTLTFQTLSGIEHEKLISFLDARTRLPELATFRSFRLICPSGTFLDDAIDAPSSSDGKSCNDKVKDHLANLAKNRGLHINIGDNFRCVQPFADGYLT
ncbi:hypothetical protein DFH08DRAFT_832454 [Mycena albidolilacea]|uniref:F-box domain-containing protein n=1 Tax=Mycena albidolilacea TaxID=1033008 RepID=A0AAD7AVN0_9AGAR|nr:hypothetical protein DFH08DRAFT_832454 [Mycena albidolilacea]